MNNTRASLTRQELLSTYRYLRLAMPGLAFLLAVGVTIQILKPSPDCWLGSISAYYYTPARAIFVACLCAIGACLIVYKGSTFREDMVLNCSGILAFFVALIPTPLGEAKTGENTLCGRSNVPTPTQLTQALDNNVWSGLAALIMMAIAYAVFGEVLSTGEGRPSPKAVAAIWGLTVVLVGVQVVWPEKVRSYGHYVAAIGLFVGVILMVLMHAWPNRFAGRQTDGSPSDGYRRFYAGVIGVMGLVLVVAVIMKLAGADNALFVLETGLIAAFVMFWSAQTKETWSEENDALLAAHAAEAETP